MRWFFAWLALLLCAIGLSFWCAASDRLPGDLWLTRRIQDLPDWFEPLAEILRAATTTWIVVIAGATLAAVASLISRKWTWLIFAGIMLVVPPIQALIKNLVDRPRPDATLIERRGTFTSESFPSGHVLGATAFVLLCALIIVERVPAGWPRFTTWWAAAAVLCLVNGLANVYEGVHWPSDVLGGYLWAGVFVLGAWQLAKRAQP